MTDEELLMNFMPISKAEYTQSIWALEQIETIRYVMRNTPDYNIPDVLRLILREEKKDDK